MGFGTLFIGYVFTLAIAYYSYTDAVCGVIILMGLNKLSGINRGFFYGMIAAAAFTLLGVGELGISAWDMMGNVPDVVYSVIATVRYAALAVLTVFILIGITDVAKEVGIKSIEARADKLKYATIIVYVLSILLEASSLGNLIDTKILVTLSVTVIIATLGLNVAVLIQIYGCYMKICMPKDREIKEKPSKFGFVRQLREHEAERQREYAEYRAEKLKKKREKKK